MSEQCLVSIQAEPYDENSGCEPMLLFWYVEQGQPVVEGQELCEIESAKAVFVITAPCSGTLAEVLVHEGDAVESAHVLGRICPEAAPDA
jgi:pyruvate/2-oxoglutarate dehydrogenase complex dihydrolipoamide acyltransferase (E2) component